MKRSYLLRRGLLYRFIGMGEGDKSSILFGMSYPFIFFFFSLSVIFTCFIKPLASKGLVNNGLTLNIVWKQGWVRDSLLDILFFGSFYNIASRSKNVSFEMFIFLGILISISAFIFLYTISLYEFPLNGILPHKII